MITRWRSLSADASRRILPFLRCLVGASVVAIGVGVVGLFANRVVPGRPNLPWPDVLIDLGVPVLGFALWGLFFRRFAFGSAWIAATIALAGTLAWVFIVMVAADARGKDSIGHGIVAIFGSISLFITLIIASSIAYAGYWRRKWRIASSGNPSTGSEPSAQKPESGEGDNQSS